MVFLKSILLREARRLPRRYIRGSFIDSLRLHVCGGTGGNGLPKYGGVGGKGGDVLVLAHEDMDLRTVKKKYPTKRIAAATGENSHKNRILGTKGADVVIDIPVGVTVYDEFGRMLGEVNAAGSSLLIARGGPGGCPGTQYTGLKGQAHSVVLDLKIIADVGLVGFPNAGKSTLLKAISNANPKIASYPFTTVRPNIGTLMYPDQRQITMADLPGLIEGAHANYGKGHKFLKHVERTKILLLVVDIGGFQLSPHHKRRTCLETVLLLNKEIELYKESLLNKPAVILVNKMDSEDADHKWSEIKDKLKHLKDVVSDFPEEFRPQRTLEFWDTLPISAKTDIKSVLQVKDRIRHILDLLSEENSNNSELQLLADLGTKMVQVGPKVI